MMPWWGYLGVMLVAVGSVVALMVNALVRLDRHQTGCPCKQCDHRRNKRDLKLVVKQRKRVLRKYDQDDSGGVVHDDARLLDEGGKGWIDTAHIDQGMAVSIRGVHYTVLDVKTDVRGYLIQLGNKRTGKRVIVTVRFDAAHRKFWKLTDG